MPTFARTMFVELRTNPSKPQQNQAAEGGDIQCHEVLIPPGNQGPDTSG